jgi:hypothetical protein
VLPLLLKSLQGQRCVRCVDGKKWGVWRCVTVEVEGEDGGSDKNVIGVTEASSTMQSAM